MKVNKYIEILVDPKKLENIAFINNSNNILNFKKNRINSNKIFKVANKILSEKQLFIFILSFKYGMSQMGISRSIKISQPAVNKLLRRSIRKIQFYLKRKVK